MANRKRLTLKELIEGGYLAAGEEMTCVPSIGAAACTATLGHDGRIRFGDQAYRTPSGWARALAGGSRNGWTYVRRARDGRTLESIHKDALNGAAGAAGKARMETGDHDHGRGDASSRVGIEESGVGSSELLDRILRLSPDAFETLVGELLTAKGFEEVVVTGRSNDGGIDGHCGIPFVKIKIAFQAKRWKNNVPIEPVQRLVGSISEQFDRGILVTTSGYTAAATAWVEEKNRPIVLLDGRQFVQQLIDLGLGVKQVPLVKLAIDDDFFAGLSR